MKSPFIEVLHDPNLRYPKELPYNPDEIYPEIEYEYTPSLENKVFEAVRKIFVNCDLDKKNIGTRNWNPLGNFIREGDVVAIKPNLVKDTKQRSDYLYQAIITHASVIRAIIDYAYIATGNSGKINVFDGPIDTTDFSSIINTTGLSEIVAYLKSKGTPVNLYDVRSEYLKKVYSFELFGYDFGFYKLKKLSGDPHGYYKFNLKKDSEFAKVEERCKFLNSTQLVRDSKMASEMHSDGNHIYGICGSIITSDIIINIPKLKTHKKLGMTLCLKNLVGVTDPRYWLPHYTSKNKYYCDEYDYKKPVINTIFKIYSNIGKIKNYGCIQILKVKKRSNLSPASKISIKGSNPRNDTIWRTCLDINKIVVYGDRNEKMQAKPQRKVLNFIDGVVGGEGDGPMSPDPVDSKLLIFSDNSTYADIIASSIIGVEQNNILTNSKKLNKYKLIDKVDLIKKGYGKYHRIKFKLPPTWR